MIKWKLHHKLSLLLKRMSEGVEITLKSGHKLVIAEGQEEPGFLATRSWDGKTECEHEEIIMQIGSETAWLMLIDHAKNMTEEEFLQLSFRKTKLPGSYNAR